MIPSFAKRLGLAAGTAVASPTLGRRLLRDRGVIFMLHRFRNPDLGLEGHDPEALRAGLDYLRSRRYELLGLEELFRRLESGAPRVRGAIAFTIDDGYADQATIGAPIFAEFDCPVTTFVTTGFLDGTTWGWWDRVSHVFGHTRARRIRVQLGERRLEYAWSDAREREAAREDFTVRCKGVVSKAAEDAIIALATEAGVALPAQAPAECAAMSWEDLRRCEARGMSFGPHTVTHPVLARADDHQAEYEIVESWRRLRQEARAPTPVFCYPNGQPGDFGDREIGTLARSGFLGSVVGTPGYAHADAFRSGSRTRYLVPRYQWPEDVAGLARFASGLERVKHLIMGRV